MNELNKAILYFCDHGYSVRKLSKDIIKIQKGRFVDVNVKHIINTTFVMYKPFASSFDYWKFDIGELNQDLDDQYKKRCGFDIVRALKLRHISNNKPSLRQYIRHRNYPIDGTFAINIEPYKYIYSITVAHLHNFIVDFFKDGNDKLHNPKIPKNVKYVALKCKGDSDKFLYGDGWNTNPHYLERLLVDFMKFQKYHDQEYNS